MGFELSISPLAYGKVWINLFRNSTGVLNLMMNCVIWLLIGFPVIIFLIFGDTFYLIKILTFHNGCKFGKADELAEEIMEAKARVDIYNQTRATVISLYKRL